MEYHVALLLLNASQNHLQYIQTIIKKGGFKDVVIS
jgi:hypothetical protein